MKKNIYIKMGLLFLVIFSCSTKTEDKLKSINQEEIIELKIDSDISESKYSNIEEFLNTIQSMYYLTMEEANEARILLKNELLESHNDFSGNYYYFNLLDHSSEIGIKINIDNNKYVFSKIYNDLSVKNNYSCNEIEKNYFIIEPDTSIFNTESGLYVLSEINADGRSIIYKLIEIGIIDISKIDFMSPYDLDMGMERSLIADAGTELKLLSYDKYEFYKKEINSFFNRYILWIDDDEGLYYIKTIGYNIRDDVDLNNKYTVIKNQLIQIYGIPDKTEENKCYWYSKGNKKIIWLFIQDRGDWSQVILEYSFINKEPEC